MPSLPVAQRQFAVELVERLRGAGYLAYFAGGCVRDQLLGYVPKDFDVATNARPDEVRQLFGHRRTLAIGASFGVIAVLGPPDAGQIDVATFRQDLQYTDGRRPDEVAFTSPELDAQRRDFTINGLFYDPVADEVIDYVGGQADLERKVVRAIGDPRQRFEEDKLRLLRAVRFTATYGFELEAATAAAIRDMAPQIKVVSAERIGAELRRMLQHASRAAALQFLADTKLLPEILPELAALQSAAPGSARAADWQETLRVLKALSEPSLGLAFATALHRAVQPIEVDALARRLRYTNKESSRAQWLVAHAQEIVAAPKLPWPKLQRLLIHDGAGELVALCAAIAGPSAPAVEFCHRLLALPAEELNPPPLLTGDDLLRHGFRPSPAMRDLIERVRDAQLDKQITSRDEALALARQLAAAGSP